MKKDIENKEDIREFVNEFYKRVGSDDLLGPVFNDYARVDWAEHLPRMYDFWNSLLFGSMEYKGQPFPKHAALPVTGAHFDRWISLFRATVDELFSGRKAEEAKDRAVSIATVFRIKMNA